MRFQHVLLGVALMSGVAGVAQARYWPITSVEYLDDKRVVLYIDDQELENGPQWNPEMRELPLSVYDAVSLAKDWAAKNHPDYDAFDVHEVVLKHIATHEHHRRWFYLIYLDAKVGGRFVPSAHLFAAVLFDGKVIPAVEEPKP